MVDVIFSAVMDHLASLWSVDTLWGIAIGAGIWAIFAVIEAIYMYELKDRS
jgi:hypothetical protein